MVTPKDRAHHTLEMNVLENQELDLREQWNHLSKAADEIAAVMLNLEHDMKRLKTLREDAEIAFAQKAGDSE